MTSTKTNPGMKCPQPPVGETSLEDQVPALPRLLGRQQTEACSARQRWIPKGSTKLSENSYQESNSTVKRVSSEMFPVDWMGKLGAGTSGGVYTVKGNFNKDKVVKVFESGDWSEVIKESSFSQDMKANDPQHFVECFGIGSTVNSESKKLFAVFERAEGVPLRFAAPRFHLPGDADSLGSASQALEVIDQLSTIMIRMMTPDSKSKLHFHMDLKPDNIMVAKAHSDKGTIKLKVVDYGIVKTCSSSDIEEIKDATLQMYRWLAWELLWVLSSEQFRLETVSGHDQENPWEQLPEGFSPFFKPSSMRPPAYRSAKLSPEVIESAMKEPFFQQVMSPRFRKQWAEPETAANCLGKLLGNVFYRVALASDRLPVDLDFFEIRTEIRSLKGLALSTDLGTTG
eukprot:TRINITY_DN111311_c0_g1_i1.p1 TRINITY_DN111311_c0_g1~~TRINITY_DN111311_c0_g1_i1.p1  ORF type:complete len:431 (-),score=93.59 TRINITY_DN111311_c0_g1_i1:627-1823(-)